MGFTDEGRFPEEGMTHQLCKKRCRARDEFTGCHVKTPAPKVPGFLFLDDRRPGRGVAIRDRCVGPGEFISAPGTRKSCGFRTLHEI